MGISVVAFVNQMFCVTVWVTVRMTQLQAHQAAQAVNFIVTWTAFPPHHTTHWTER
jgi:hypothetical protein